MMDARNNLSLELQTFIDVTTFSLTALMSVTLLDFFTTTAQKTRFSIEDFFSKCDQIRSFLRIWSHLLEKFLMENFILCAVTSQ